MRPYKDPDEFIQALGSEAFEERINKAESAIMFEVRMLSENYNQNDPEEKTTFQKETAKKLALIDEPLERSNYIEAVANLYHIDSKALGELVHKYGISGAAKPDIVVREERRIENENSENHKEDKKNKSAKLLLTWLVNEPSLFRQLDGIIDEHNFEAGIYRIVAEKLFSQFRTKGKVEPATIITTFEGLDEQRLVAEMLQTDIRIDMTDEEMNLAVTDVVKKIKLASIEEELSHTNDIAVMQKLIREKAGISKLHISI
jgi:DNA primase